MKNQINVQQIVYALAATLLLAGLFYLPYMAVRTKTIEAFHLQQSLVAQQVAANFAEYYSTYEKALNYLVQQPGVQRLDEGGRALLRDFYTLHPEDILAIHRIDAAGKTLFTIPEAHDNNQSGANAASHCRQVQALQAPAVSAVQRFPNDYQLLYFSETVGADQGQEGCLSLALPFSKVTSRYLDKIPLAHQGHALLFSRDGVVLSAPDQNLVGKSSLALRGLPEELATLRTAISGEQETIVPLSQALLSEHREEEGEDSCFAVVRPVTLSGNIHWSIVLVTPAKEVLGAMAEFRSLWLVVTAVAIIMVGLLSLFLGTIVTKRREEQRQLALEEQLTGLLDLAPMGVLLLGANYGIQYANRAAKQMLGREERESILGQSFLGLLHPDCQEQVMKDIARPAAGQATEVEQVHLAGAFGSPREVVITATSCRLGAQSQTILILRDVTEERRTAAQQRHLSTAVDQVKEGVLIADRSGYIDYVNATLSEMSGYHRNECRRQPVDMLWSKDQDPQVQQKIEAAIDKGEVWRGRTLNQRKDGSLFMAAVTVSAMRDIQGRVTHFVLVQRDITQEVEIENRLRQAQKMEAIGTLAGGIAHDFNNILGGIIGFTDMALLIAPPDTDMHSYLTHIRQGGKRAADLVQQILTFSRQSAMEKVAVPVASLVKESLKLMRATLPATIDIHQDLEAAEVMVLAAPVQIQQIVMNLCANAFYAMRDQGGCLTIRLRCTPAEGKAGGERGQRSWVVLTVEDTGKGIDSDILPNIFTPFFTTKQPGEGTGMGLSVVHGIIRELGGEIGVQSQPGKGTTFTVHLPVAENGHQGTLSSGEAPLPGGSEHILVVDDEREIRETCRMMLSYLGYTVITTGNPLEVEHLVATSQPPISLVLTDHTMPKMTGLDLARMIQRVQPGLPVILCTGYSDRLNAEIAYAAGACALVMKPMDLRGLGDAVRAALDQAQAS